MYFAIFVIKKTIKYEKDDISISNADGNHIILSEKKYNTPWRT